MTEKQDAYLIDYIAIGIIGFAIGQALSSVAGFETSFIGFFGGIDWGRIIADDVSVGIFAFIPGGFLAGYLCYKLLGTEGKSEGFTGGLMSFVAYFIITLIMTIARTGIWSADYGTSMEIWVVLMVFALIFFPAGGFLSGMVHDMKTALPPFMKMQFLKNIPPPPPPSQAMQTCPSCGSPLRYIEQYQRWYCDKEKKYV